MIRVTMFLSILTLVHIACNPANKGPLPIIGDRVDLDGNKVVHEIREFSFQDQTGRTITNNHFKDKIYVVDFFFTSCPSICPKVTAEMRRMYDHIIDYEDVLLVSHTIDPKRDSISVLKAYADNLNIDHNKWLFLRGE